MWCLPRVRRTRATCACFTDPPHMVCKLLGPHGGQRSINRSPGAVRAISAHHATLKRAIRSKNDRRASKPRCRLCVVHTACPSITWRQWRSACAVNIPRGGNGPSRGQPEEGCHPNLQPQSLFFKYTNFGGRTICVFAMALGANGEFFLPLSLAPCA